MAEHVWLTIGSWHLYTLGLALALAFVVVAAAAIPAWRGAGVRRVEALTTVLLLMAATMVGSRVAYVTSEAPAASAAGVWQLPVDGLSYYGGLAAMLVALAVLSLRLGRSFWQLADAIAPGIALGMTVALSVVLSTGLLRPTYGPMPLLGILLLTVSYMATYAVWLLRWRWQFTGQAMLALLFFDSVLRWILTPFWQFAGQAGGSGRTSLAVLVGTIVCWFVRRGASVREAQTGSAAGADALRKTKPGWWLGYAAVLSLFIWRAVLVR